MEGRLGRFINRVRNRLHASAEPRDDWARLEKRMPGFRERMMRARVDLEAGRGYVLNGNLTVETFTSQPSTAPTTGEPSLTATEVWSRLDAAKPGLNDSVRRGIQEVNEGGGIEIELVEPQGAEQPHQE